MLELAITSDIKGIWWDSEVGNYDYYTVNTLIVQSDKELVVCSVTL